MIIFAEKINNLQIYTFQGGLVKVNFSKPLYNPFVLLQMNYTL